MPRAIPCYGRANPTPPHRWLQRRPWHIGCTHSRPSSPRPRSAMPAPMPRAPRPCPDVPSDRDPPRLPRARDVVPSPLHVATTRALLLLTPCIPRHHVVTVACPCHARVHATHYSLHPRCRTCAATPRSRTLYMSSPFVRVCRVYCFARVV